MNKTPEPPRTIGLPRHEAMAIACWATGRDRSWFAARTADEMAADLRPEEQALIQVLTNRRAAGEPLAYLLGFREFYGRRFMVNPSVLIPRSDTECLVEAVLTRMADARPNAHSTAEATRLEPLAPPIQVLDLGTGSGCLAISLALEARARHWEVVVTATDRSASALQVARNNAHWLGAKVRFCEGDWYGALGEAEGRFDLVVSNPPYIAAQDPHLGLGDLPFEPLSALAGCQPNADGLDDLRLIIEGVPGHLRPGGWLLVEHGHDQQPAVVALMRAAGLRHVLGQPDLSGTPRLVMGQL